MTFVWKITCRRLQTSGALVRFADGEISAQERDSVESHLAQCPACQAVVADALAVAGLLKANVPSGPGTSLAASGSLWATLEAKIAATPQEKASAAPSAVRAPERRLQRFGQWLATPGALPFGAVAAAAVGLVGIAVYHQGGITSETAGGHPVTALRELDSAEISIIPTPKPVASSARTAMTANASGSAQARLASAASAASAEDNAEIAPLRRKAAVRGSLVAQAERPVAAESEKLSAPRAPAPPYQTAQAELYAFSSAPAAASAPVSDATVVPPAQPVSPEDFGAQQSVGAPGLAGPGIRKRKERGEMAPSASIAPMPMMRAMVTSAPAPAISEPTLQAGASASDSDKISASDLVDVPTAHSLTDMAIQQRRQQSLFSYATR